MVIPLLFLEGENRLGYSGVGELESAAGVLVFANDIQAGLYGVAQGPGFLQ